MKTNSNICLDAYHMGVDVLQKFPGTKFDIPTS